MSCSKSGDLYCTQEAVGSQEQWIAENLGSGFWAWKSVSTKKYLTLSREKQDQAIACVSDTVIPEAKWRIRVQTRFLKKNKSSLFDNPTIHSRQLESM